MMTIENGKKVGNYVVKTSADGTDRYVIDAVIGDDHQSVDIKSTTDISNASRHQFLDAFDLRNLCLYHYYTTGNASDDMVTIERVN